MIKDGKKWACESCVRGHRVSNCTHEDRPLTMIKPKGRPVKQCEHCRTSRKSKSHHGKCDCGSKKEKKDKAETKIEDSDCCCHRGDNCVCGIKGDNQAARMERSLKRSSTAPTVKSKPMTKSHSDVKLTVVTSHHKPSHRHNNAAHTSGAPYPSRQGRPHTLMGPSAFATSPESLDILNILTNGGRSADDLFVQTSSSMSSYRSSDVFSTSSSRPFSLSNSRTNSSESFDVDNFQAFDFDLMNGSAEMNEMTGSGFGDGWLDATSPTSPQFSTSSSLQQYVTSPNFVDEYSSRSAVSELADIPEFGQYPSSTTSNGRESSRSPPSLATPVQSAVDHHRHAHQSYSLEQLSDSNSLERWSSSGTSDLDMLSSAMETSRGYGHSRNLSESSTESGFTPTVLDSMVINESPALEMSMPFNVDLSTISPEYMDLARRYDWL